MTQPFVFDDPSYVQLEAKRLGGRVEEFDLGQEHPTSLISQEIPGSRYRDLVSVYGYPELISQTAVITTTDLNNFLDRLASKGRERGLVAGYLRLGLSQEIPSPSSDQDNFIASRVHVGDVVVIDLSLNSDTLMSKYRKQLRYDLRQPHEFWFEKSENFAAFHTIYSENMDRIGAKSSYFFSQSYLSRLGGLDGAELWLARDAIGAAAGCLFLRQGDLIYYHLGATANRALSTSPLKHLMHHRIQALAETGARYLVLGGGLAGEEDALLRFKRGFSKRMMPVQALRVIFDMRAYSDLTGQPLQQVPNNGFFPAYRSHG